MSWGSFGSSGNNGGFGTFGSSFNGNNLGFGGQNNNTIPSWLNPNNSNANSNGFDAFGAGGSGLVNGNRPTTDQEKERYAIAFRELYTKCNLPDKIKNITSLIRLYGTTISNLHAVYIRACDRYKVPQQFRLKMESRAPNNSGFGFNNNNNNDNGSSWGSFGSSGNQQNQQNPQNQREMCRKIHNQLPAHNQMQGLSAANNDRGFGLQSGNRRNLNHNGSNNGNTVISLIDSNRSNQSISGSTQNRVNWNNVITRLAVESKATTEHWIQMQFGRRRGISVTKMVVSTIDSYSQKRIEVPVRGRACPHLQPFDAKSFLSRPEQYQKCTQCNKRIRKEHLVKMEYFQLIFDHLEKFHPKVERIEIQRDGTWHKVLQQHR